MLRYLENKYRNDTLAVFDDHSKVVADILNKSRQKEVADLLRKQQTQLFNTLKTDSQRDLLEMAKDQISYTYQKFESIMSRIWRSKRPSMSIAEDIVLKRPLLFEKTLMQGWGHLEMVDRRRLEQVLRIGMSKGMNPQELALLLRQQGIHQITRAQSIGLTTTAMTSVHNQADFAVYDENADVLRGWMFVAVLDSRTTGECRSHHGTIYAIEDLRFQPPLHFNCRSASVPVVKNFEQLAEIKSLDRIRTRNLEGLHRDERAALDQIAYIKSYEDWLLAQNTEVQLRHLGSSAAYNAFHSGQLKVNFNTETMTIQRLRLLLNETEAVGDTRRFALAKQKLDMMDLSIRTPEDLYNNLNLVDNLREYYLLNTQELDGLLSLTNYRGITLATKRKNKLSVLNIDVERRYNPITRIWEDPRLYAPNPLILQNRIRLVEESTVLLSKDKEFIINFIMSLDNKMSSNEQAVIVDNLRILFTRYRESGEAWKNFKAVSVSQIKFDIHNISDALERATRTGGDVLKRLKEINYVDPVLGQIDLESIAAKFVDNILAMRTFEDNRLPILAMKYNGLFTQSIPFQFWGRISLEERQKIIEQFFMKLIKGDTVERDNLAIWLGQKIYQSAAIRGDRNEWFTLGMSILEKNQNKGLFVLETFGVQKRRMHARMTGQYFGQVYDTSTWFVRVTEKELVDYGILSRRVDIGLRMPILDRKQKLYIKPGYKTYFDYKNRNTFISIVSDAVVPDTLIDAELANALNWAASSQFKIDKDFHDAMVRLLMFKDDKGKAAFYDALNTYKEYISGREDAYERFKVMEWLVKRDSAFSNIPFIDHRARIYERGFIGPQAGEGFRPYLNTATRKQLTPTGFRIIEDHIGSVLGGLDDYFERSWNSLTVVGRQKIAEYWRPKLIELGYDLRNGKPNAIRKILSSEIYGFIDGEDQAKVLRFALELSKIDEHLRIANKIKPYEQVGYVKALYTEKGLTGLQGFRIGLALEQDASSSGAQIIALTTRNKQLASMSNVIMTDQKRRLYDEIASLTFQDARFRRLNERSMLSEKDLRKAAKAQNMVTFYGAGKKTGALNVEAKLSKALSKTGDRLIVSSDNMGKVLDEISAFAARYKRSDPRKYEELMALRKDIRDMLRKGLSPGDDLMEELYFLSSSSRDFLNKMSLQYLDIITPADFEKVAAIMSEYLAESAPILQDFTKFFGGLAKDYLEFANPRQSDYALSEILKTYILQGRLRPKLSQNEMGKVVNNPIIRKVLMWIFDLKHESMLESTMQKFAFWDRNGTLADFLLGVKTNSFRRHEFKIKFGEIKYPVIDGLNISGGKSTLWKFNFGFKDDLPKKWTQVPWVNWDNKTLEQKFTQRFDELLSYKNKDGTWSRNIVQVSQKTEPTLWESLLDTSNTFNDIADVNKAATAYGVNGNHSNDATLVKRFHLWGKKNGIATSTVHDAFFTNVEDLNAAKLALYDLYKRALSSNSIKATLDEMRKRGLPKELYDKWLNTAIEKGLIPIPGRSKVGGKLLRESDILSIEDFLKFNAADFTTNRSWYGIGG